MVIRPTADVAAPPIAPPPPTRLRRIDWLRTLLGLVFTLVVSVPTLAIEEDWHGRPLIDQPHHKWVLPAIVVAAALVIGGAIAASRLRWWLEGALHGAVVGAVSSGLLVVADVIRRHELHKFANPGVTRLWVVAAVAATILGAIGGAFRPWDNRGPGTLDK
jgi:hypothetical protein